MKAREADEFSFVGEHIEDEPSIHIRSLHQLKSIMRQQPLPKAPPLKKKDSYDYSSSVKTATTE
jgi:hypothetical protein